MYGPFTAMKRRTSSSVLQTTAQQPHPKGSTVLPTAEAVAWVQCADSRASAIVCAQCACFVGGTPAQVALVSGAAAVAAEALGGDGGDWRACPLGCGEVFCSQACCDQGLRGAHGPLCVGPHTEEHPLYLFRIAAFASGAYDEWLLAARVAVLVAQGQCCAVWEDVPPLWDLVPPDLDPEAAAAYRAETERVAREAWALLEAGLGPGFWEDAEEPWGAEDWGRVLTYVLRAREAVERRTPAEVRCAGAYLLGGAAALGEAEEAEALLRCARVRDEGEGEGEEEEEEEGEGAGEGEGGEDDGKRGKGSTGGGGSSSSSSSRGAAGGDSACDPAPDIGRWTSELPDDVALAKLFATPTTYFPRFRALALYPPALAQLPHSCVASCDITVAEEGCNPGLRASLFAAQALAHGDPLTVCRVDVSAPYDERQDELAMRGLPRCACDRCRFEGGDAAAVDAAALRALAGAAQRGERHDDALAALEELLRRDPADGDALYDRARVLGWADRWSEAHRQLVAAGRIVPDHAEVAAKLREARAYFSGPGAGPGGAACVPSAVPGLGGRAVAAEGLLDPAACARLIAEVEEAMAAHGGWTTARHYAVPTTDVPVHRVPGALRWFNAVLERHAFPLIARQFAVAAAALRVIDAFVVKYMASGGQRSLPLHCDQSQFSLTIALNSTAEYEGGGTYFADIGRAINCDAGGIISFDGSLLHGGHPLSSGTRYIVVAFIYAYDGLDE